MQKSYYKLSHRLIELHGENVFKTLTTATYQERKKKKKTHTQLWSLSFNVFKNYLYIFTCQDTTTNSNREQVILDSLNCCLQIRKKKEKRKEKKLLWN